MVKGMRRGSVIVDLAAETGGNCEVTQPGQVVEVDGIWVDGTTNVPSTMALHASSSTPTTSLTCSSTWEALAS